MIDYRYTPGPVHLVRLGCGEDAYDSLTEYARTNNIRAASLTFLGAVRRASLRYYDQDERRYVDFTIDEHLEVLAGVGNLSVLDGEPFLHAHAAFADADGRAFGGHLNRGTEVFALEATIWQLDGTAPVREPDDCTGLTLWGGTLPPTP